VVGQQVVAAVLVAAVLVAAVLVAAVLVAAVLVAAVLVAVALANIVTCFHYVQGLEKPTKRKAAVRRSHIQAVGSSSSSSSSNQRIHVISACSRHISYCFSVHFKPPLLFTH
jgi:hypothetical protein